MLVAGGALFVSELHPLRQHRGARATFTSGGERRRIPAFVHDVPDYLTAATANGFDLRHLDEWRHQRDPGESPPRLVSFRFGLGD